MKERPILFSAPMVRALLDGTKTQTRRIVADFQQPKIDTSIDISPSMRWGAIAQNHRRWGFAVFGETERECADRLAESGCCRYGQQGDRLWVRESYADIGCRLTYRADEDDGAHCKVKKWTPSIHMFRADSRILLEIVSVRVERLNDCSDADAVAEGIGLTPAAIGMKLTFPPGESMCVNLYRQLWESINGVGSWDSNAWVWVIEFKRVMP